jgi:hypothetical protein
MGLRTKNDCDGEAQQQFTRPAVPTPFKLAVKGKKGKVSPMPKHPEVKT